MIAIYISSFAILAIAQSATSKYQPGTIMAVEPHASGPGEKASSRTYDVSVKVDNTIYVVLYTQPPGTISPLYRVGLQILVSVGSNTIKFNDQLGRSQELPILSRRTLPDAKQKNAHPISLHRLIRTPTQAQI